jgi:hypothetical protein
MAGRRQFRPFDKKFRSIPRLAPKALPWPSLSWDIESIGVKFFSCWQKHLRNANFSYMVPHLAVFLETSRQLMQAHQVQLAGASAMVDKVDRV